MNKAKKCDSTKEPSPRDGWPTAVQAVTPFIPPDSPDAKRLVTIQLLDYSIFTVLKITSISGTPLTVADLIVNGEFHPMLTVTDHTDWFTALRLPKPMSPDSSFRAVLQAPVMDSVKPACCYPKAPASVLILTDLGNFTFLAGESIRFGGKS